MNQQALAEERYKELVNAVTPDSKTGENCLRAFLCGGAICVLGQFINNCFTSAGFGKDPAASYTAVILVLLSVVLTAAGLYAKIGKFAGAGSVVPITGFANAVAAPAVEFKKEGLVMGVGARMFIVAGPVIVFGTLASMIMGLIYWFTRMR
ncbi:MAG: stage V sporulation protein AC [Clostridiales bacterium]|jgi:stage V sporulation protein AC|nr:stage V sporulation protein AC [Clostridiales bacterium]